MAFRETGKNGRDQLPEELGGEPSLQPLRRLGQLTSRVLDDSLRDKLTVFMDAAIKAGAGAIRDEPDEAAQARADAALQRTLDLMLQVQDEIGRQLRALYDDA